MKATDIAKRAAARRKPAARTRRVKPLPPPPRKARTHVQLVIDRSGSMRGQRWDAAREALVAQIATLHEESAKRDLPTDVGLVMFDTRLDALAAAPLDAGTRTRLLGFFDNHPPDGYTALLDAAARGIKEAEAAVASYPGDAGLVLVLTDGEENSSRLSTSRAAVARACAPDHRVSVAFIGPASMIAQVARYGVPEGNCQVWEGGAAELDTIRRDTLPATIQAYYGARGLGMVTNSTTTRGGNLFVTQAAHIDPSAVAAHAAALVPRKVIHVAREEAIREVVERATRRPYIIGEAYYQLMKAETVQANKALILRSKADGTYHAGAGVRAMLGLPGHDVRVKPGNHGDWDIFVQSTSVNRKLVRGTDVVVTP